MSLSSHSGMENNSTFLKKYNTENLMASEAWPDDPILYQPFEAEQILLAENASCLAVKAYLKMCNKPFTIKSCANAEFMSPGGRMTKLPFIKAGAFIKAEFEEIVHFMEQKDIVLASELDPDEKCDMRAYMSLVENIFTMAELYVSFVDELVYTQVTCPRNGCVFPWPLNHIQNYKKRQQAFKTLDVYGYKGMSQDEVVEKVEKCCETLCRKLEETGTPYFFGYQPTEMDAITFGHLFTILTTKLPNNILAETVQRYKKLIDFCKNIDAVYFQPRAE